MPSKPVKKNTDQEKRKRGRPPKYDEMPPPIPDTPDNIAGAVMRAKPKRPGEWRYQKK